VLSRGVRVLVHTHSRIERAHPTGHSRIAEGLKDNDQEVAINEWAYKPGGVWLELHSLVCGCAQRLCDSTMFVDGLRDVASTIPRIVAGWPSTISSPGN